jgi:sigma-B regulation protein RsbU (phosphoserine phosphatase)
VALIYIADDDQVVALFTGGILEACGHEVRTFSDGPPVLEALRSRSPDLLLTDLNMTTMDGLAVLAAARATLPHLPVVMVTGSSQLTDAIQALRAGAVDYVTKPIDPDLLNQVVQRVLRVANLEEEVRRANAEIAARDAVLTQELRIASTIQRALLPSKPPDGERIEIGLAFATAGEIGGDYFSFSTASGSPALGVLLADITGHGIPAALLFCLFKQIVDPLLGLRSEVTPSNGMTILNRRVARDFPAGHFASTLYAEIDPVSMVARCVKGGQEPMLVVRDGEIVASVDEGGPLIGAFDPAVFGEHEYAEQTVRLERNDTVFFYTDGLIEAANASGVQAGVSSLKKWLREERGLAPQALADRLIERVLTWTERESLDDDVTVIVVHVK